MADCITTRFDQHAEALAAARALAPQIRAAAEIIIDALKAGGGVYLFGNGGSAADAQHIAGEFVGRFEAERRPLRAVALNCDTATLTAIGNDYGYQATFLRQLEALASPGDVAWGLSTSGNSPNVVTALAWANANGLRTIAMTAAGGGQCGELAEVLLAMPVKRTATAQEIGMLVYHILCEMVEKAFVEP